MLGFGKKMCQLSTPLNLFKGWMNLLETHPVTNGKVFDLFHIGIMLSHQLPRIYTFNANDFLWCNEIEVIDPSAQTS